MPKERLIVFQRGHRVGELAQELFPGGINMSPGHPAAFKKALINTQEKIKEGFPVIYEAAFQYDQVLIFLDVLVHTATGWHAYEVKSSGGISDTYLMDAALQYHVIKGSGLDISGISLVHINKEYILEDEIDPKGLFKIINVTDEALSRQEYVVEQIIREKGALDLQHSPKIDVGAHCREPYDCDFIGHCWKNIPKPPKRNPSQQINIENFKDRKIDLKESTVFLKLLPMLPAIPMYRGTHPYQDIIYGYGLANMEGKASNTQIHGHESNPEEKLIHALRSDMMGVSNVICFGQSYLLKNIFPNLQILDLKEFIMGESDFFTGNKDRSELERLRITFGLMKNKELPEYKSDAVSEHYYLKDYPDDESVNKLKDYTSSWVTIIEELFNYMISVS